MWKFVSTPCITAAVRSRPMPVSMFLLGSGRRLSGGSPTRLNCVKTRFQISTWPKWRVVIDFAARAADAVGTLAGGVGRPEIFVFAQPLQPLGRQLNFVEPDAGRLVVVEIDRGRKPLRAQAQPLLAR